MIALITIREELDKLKKTGVDTSFLEKAESELRRIKSIADLFKFKGKYDYKIDSCDDHYFEVEFRVDEIKYSLQAFKRDTELYIFEVDFSDEDEKFVVYAEDYGEFDRLMNKWLDRMKDENEI
jgi:hypothetical protein